MYILSSYPGKTINVAYLRVDILVKAVLKSRFIS